MAKNRKSILWFEDDIYVIEAMAEHFKYNNIDVYLASTPKEAVQYLENPNIRIDLAICDIMLKVDPSDLDIDSDNYSGRRSGLQFARYIKEKYPKIKIVGFSVVQDPDVTNWFQRYGAGFFNKPMFPSDFLEEIETILYPKRPKRKPKIFIVHGQDHQVLYEVKNYLQNTLQLGEPVILREQPSLGKTIIEKFEDESKNIDLVFVLLTPDDKVSPKNSTDVVKMRARQNVIFELGFFYSKMQRKKGKTILLHKGQVELPSDISGVIYIDISRGVESASEEIRRELYQWL